MSAFTQAKELGGAGEDEPELTTYCSFVATGTNVFHQGIYVCNTCNGAAENLCCCSGCATYCHAGHDVGFVASGDAYCDCGASHCSLYEQTLRANIHGSIPQSSPMMTSAINLLRQKPFEEFTMNNIDYDRAILEAKELITQSKETFWVPATGASPRCYAEKLAHDIGMAQLQEHWASAVSPALFQQALTQCGFEWWVQVKTNNSNTVEVSQDNEEPNNGIDLHYDKDETVAEQFGLGIFPALSTVTYLLSDAALSSHPTLVLNCTAAQPIGAPIYEMFISIPKQGKHVSFNGELLHGAPQQILPFSLTNQTPSSNEMVSNNSTNTRITFLVNVWIGHQPASVTPLPDIIAQALAAVSSAESEFSISQYDTTVALQSVPANWLTTTVVSSPDVNAESFGDWQIIPFVSAKSQWGKEESEAGLELYCWMPQMPLQAFHNAQQLRCAAGPKLKKPRRSAQSPEQLSQASTPLIASTSTSYQLVFVGEDCAAKLEYEEDEEGAEEFGDAFCGLVTSK